MKLLIVILLFFIIANPALFKVTRALGGWVASPEGLPKAGGLILHGLVFAVSARVIMRAIRRRSKYEEEEAYEEEYAEEEYAEEDYEDETYCEKNSWGQCCKPGGTYIGNKGKTRCMNGHY